MSEEKKETKTAEEEATRAEEATAEWIEDSMLDQQGGIGATEQEVSDEELIRQELEATRDQLLRVAAEFENFKKRMEREQAKSIKYAGEPILRDLLPTLDNLDRAVEQAAQYQEAGGQAFVALLEGLELTRRGLIATLERFGVKPIDSIGRPFNPDEHDALILEPSDEAPAQQVLREFAKGYRFKDRVLRHAQVVVSAG